MKKKTSLDFLDGFRGFLANTVIIAHIGQQLGLGDIGPVVQPIVNKASYHISVMGFFVLSAFLLTYRSMIDFYYTKSLKMYIIHAAQYSIRRFFRIYLVFAILFTLIHHGPAIFTGYYELDAYADYAKGMSLSYVGTNHLWTIPTEIKYYFFIPIISFISAKSEKKWITVWLLCSACALYVEVYNPFAFPSQFSFNEGLWSRFTLFFTGSQLAILFFYLEQLPAVREYASKTIIKYILSIGLNILFIAQFWLFSSFDDKDSILSAKYQVILVFLLLYIDKTNSIARLLDSYYLRTCGRYSFGIYLLHPIVIQAFKNSQKSIPTAYHEYIFKYAMIRLLIVIGLTYLAAFFWFHLLENNLVKLANKLVKSIEPDTFGKKTLL